MASGSVGQLRPLWIAGHAFKCKGEALVDDYNGVHFSVSDMKRNVQRAYDMKRRRNRNGSPVEGVWPLQNEHDAKQPLGEVYDMFIDKSMCMWNIARISPGTPEILAMIKGIRETVRNDPSDTKPNPYGLSYGYSLNDYVNVQQPADRKRILELSIIKDPAHHEDGTYVRFWADSREDLLRALFKNTYGDAMDSELDKPFYIPNVLKNEVRLLFDQQQPAADTKDPMELDKEVSSSPDESKKEEEVAKKKEEEKEKKEEKKSEAVTPPTPAPPNAPPTAEEDKMDLEEVPAKEVPERQSSANSSTPPSSSSLAPSAPSALPQVTFGRAQGGSSGSSGPTENTSANTSPAGTHTAGEVFENKVVKDGGAPVSSLISSPAFSAPTTTESVTSPTTVHSDASLQSPNMSSAPPPSSQPQQQSAPVPPRAAPRQADSMDLVDATPPTQQNGGGVKRAFEQGTGTSDGAAQGEKQPEADAVLIPTKKQRDTTGNPRATSYTLSDHDVGVAQQAFQKSLRDLVEVAGLASADPNEQSAFIESLVADKRREVTERKRIMEEMTHAVLSEQGLDEEAIKATTEIINSKANTPEGQVMRTLLATAAAKSAGNPRLLDYKSQQQQPSGKTIFTDISSLPPTSEMSSGSRSIIRGPSAPSMSFEQRAPLESSLSKPQQQPMSAPSPRPLRNLDFTESIFGRRATSTAPSSLIFGGSGNPRLGEQSFSATPTQPSPLDEDQRAMHELVRKVNELAPYRVRTIQSLGKEHPLSSIRGEDGETALDSFDLNEHILENIRPGTFVSEFLNAVILPDLDAIKEKRYMAYGHDEINKKYYALPAEQSYNAPRTILGAGTLTLADGDD